jgi:hypothetical protein
MPHHFNEGSINRSRNQGGTKIHSKPSKSTYVAPKKSTSISKKKDKSGLLPVSLQIIQGIGKALTKGSKEFNLARRKKHITKYNTNVPPSERIDMTDEMISSNVGLNTLREKTNYKTNQDIINQGGNGGSVVKKVVGGQTLLAQGPTDAEVSQSDATNAAETKLTKRRVKARGRKMNIYTSASGKTTDKLILGKKSLLGMV